MNFGISKALCWPSESIVKTASYLFCIAYLNPNFNAAPLPLFFLYVILAMPFNLFISASVLSVDYKNRFTVFFYISNCHRNIVTVIIARNYCK